MWKILLTLGMKGDFNVIRHAVEKTRLWYPLYKLYEVFHCADIPISTKLNGDIYFPHSITGCFFSMTSQIGTGCTIMHHVTIGSNNVLDIESVGPIIGNNVFIGAGAKIIGSIRIGNDCRIGAGCVVVDSIPDGCTVVMNKPRIIQRTKKI